MQPHTTWTTPHWQIAVAAMLCKAAESDRRSIVMIGTTSRLHNPELIIAPNRESSIFLACSLIIQTKAQCMEICAFADGKADYIVIDAERKTTESPDFFTIALGIVKKSSLKTYKGNDITVQSCDLLINQLMPSLSGCRIAILGAGNIGMKLALILIERGAQVLISRRDEHAKLLAAAANSICNKYSEGFVTPMPETLDSLKEVDILIGFTQGIPVITEELVNSLKRGSLLIDGGIGTITEAGVEAALRRSLRLYRLDIRIAFPFAIDSILFADHFMNRISGRRALDDGRCQVAGGTIGKAGDIVLESLLDSASIIGIADGKGGIVREGYDYFGNKT